MNKPQSSETGKSFMKGSIKIILVLLLNAVAVFLFGRYILYPITDISDLRELSSAVSDMSVLRKIQREDITMIVYESSDNEHYVITLEENFFGDRYRVLPSGSYAIEETPPITVSAKTFTGVVQYKLGDKYQLLSYTHLNAPTYRTVAGIYLLFYVFACATEFIVYMLITRKKKNK